MATTARIRTETLLFRVEWFVFHRDHGNEVIKQKPSERSSSFVGKSAIIRDEGNQKRCRGWLRRWLLLPPDHLEEVLTGQPSFVLLRQARREDEPFAFRSPDGRTGLRALLCGITPADAANPSRTGQAAGGQRAGHSALGTWPAGSSTRAAQTVAGPRAPAPSLSC